MKTLQIIWNALTNENELALMLTSIPMTFIEVTLTLLLFTTILNIKFSKKQGVIYVILFSLSALLTTYFVPSPYNTFINLMIFPVLVYFILKTNALKAIFSEIIFYFIILCIGTPLSLVYSNIFKGSASLFNIPLYKMLYSLNLYALLFVLYKILKRFNLHITLFDKFDLYNYNILIINSLVGIVAIALQAYTQYLYTDYIPTHLIFISLALLVLYLLISLYSLFRTSKLEETKQLLETEKSYNENLSTMHDNIRGFKHDFNNIVQAIGGYLSSDNITGLKAYYKDLLEECQLNNNLAVLNPELINNPAIYSLLCDKYHKAKDANIKLDIEVMANLSNLNIKTFELTRILGILFDNAIEAASKCEKKIVSISFRKHKAHHSTLIVIQNTYTNKEINIDRIFEKGYTSKQIAGNAKEISSHGLGLWEVKKYLKKNTNLDLFTTKNEQFFTQQFEIYD